MTTIIGVKLAININTLPKGFAFKKRRLKSISDDKSKTGYLFEDKNFKIYSKRITFAGNF